LRIFLILFLVVFSFTYLGCSGGGRAADPADPPSDNGNDNPDPGDDDPWDGPMITFENVYGTTADEYARDVIQSGDDGYIVAGRTESGANGEKDIYLMKVDSDGNELWSKNIGGSNDDFASALLISTDGGIVIAGYTESSGAGGKDAYLVKTDASGNELWNQAYGAESDDEVVSLAHTSDGGYVMAGYTKSFGAEKEDIYLLRVDDSGIELWSHTFGGSERDVAYGVVETNDGGFALAGESYSDDNIGMYLVKTDGSGNEEWTSSLNGLSFNSSASVIQQTADNGFILAGVSDVFGAGSGDIYVVKTTSSGNEQWSKKLGGGSIDLAYDLDQTTDEGYVLAGYTESSGAGEKDVYLVKIDSNGEEVWTNTFGGMGTDAAYAIQQTIDLGFIFAGETDSSGAGESDIYLIKTDPDGNVE